MLPEQELQHSIKFILHAQILSYFYLKLQLKKHAKLATYLHPFQGGAVMTIQLS